ncbi:Phophatidylserine decarboxylase-domain-containing protein [Biscogniauxia mediterranea]|nr:Phophatidylserine decarboxylase-domain-containing protein [Biscogniauxia mediterranea]
MSSLIASKKQPRPFHRIGGWLPSDPKFLVAWVRQLVQDLNKKRHRSEWKDEVKDLADLIESSAELRMLASAMFDEVPDKPPYNEDPQGNKQIRSYAEMLDIFTEIIEKPIVPEWSEHANEVGLIGFPFNAVLDWPMATPSGYAFFLRREVNEKLKAILNRWRDDVLMTNASQSVITTGTDGWLSPDSLKAIEDVTNIDGKDRKFTELFKCDPEHDPDHWGFQSWDSFFVREFKDIDELRPVAEKDDPKCIVSSCESKPFALQEDVKEFDSFWLKGQPYSVAEMLNRHEKASTFVGGTVYQAFLSALSYHRWNSPVQGKIIYSSIIDGTYFSEPPITGFPDPDPAAPDKAQGYITHVATRAMFLIEAGDPIGLVACVYVGMADVSTCEILEKFQQDKLPATVEKGEEIGMFHHGGSTHCLLFPKGLELDWIKDAYPKPEDDGSETKNIPIRSKLASVSILR